MANDLDKIKGRLVQNFVTTLGEEISNYQEVANVVGWDTPTLQVGTHFGTSAFTAQTPGSAPTPEDLDSGQNVVNSVAYEKGHQITEKSVRDNPEILMQKSTDLAQAGAWSIASLFWDTFDGLDTVTHPMNGAPYAGGGGGTAYYADTYTAPVAQSNLITTALSESGLREAKQILREYQNQAGLPYGWDLSNSNLRLVVPAALEQTAMDLTMRRGEEYDGSGLSSGAYFGIQPVIMPAAADDNDWWLVHRPRTPFTMWIRRAPYLRINVQEDTGHWFLYAQLECAIVLSPNEAGYVMSKVA